MQASLEYLTTYGWSILVVVILIMAFFQIGAFSRPEVASACTSSSPFYCQNPIMYGNGLLIAQFGEAIGTLTITGYGCSNSSTPPSSYTPTSITLLSGTQTSASFSCPVSSNAIGTSFTGTLWVKYNTQSESNLAGVVGTVRTKVTNPGIYSTSISTTSTSSTSTTVPSTSSTSSTSTTSTSTSTTVSTTTINTLCYVTTNCNPTGAGKVEQGVSWGCGLNVTYLCGNSVGLVAVPIGANTFTAWACSGTGCYAGISNVTTIASISSNINETANFATTSTTTSTSTSTSTSTTTHTTTSTTTSLTTTSTTTSTSIPTTTSLTTTSTTTSTSIPTTTSLTTTSTLTSTSTTTHTTTSTTTSLTTTSTTTSTSIPTTTSLTTTSTTTSTSIPTTTSLTTTSTTTSTSIPTTTSLTTTSTLTSTSTTTHTTTSTTTSTTTHTTTSTTASTTTSATTTSIISCTLNYNGCSSSLTTCRTVYGSTAVCPSGAQGCISPQCCCEGGTGGT